MDITKLSYEELCELLQKVINEKNERDNKTQQELWNNIKKAIKDYIVKCEEDVTVETPCDTEYIDEQRFERIFATAGNINLDEY